MYTCSCVHKAELASIQQDEEAGNGHDAGCCHPQSTVLVYTMDDFVYMNALCTVYTVLSLDCLVKIADVHASDPKLSFSSMHI